MRQRFIAAYRQVTVHAIVPSRESRRKREWGPRAVPDCNVKAGAI